MKRPGVAEVRELLAAGILAAGFGLDVLSQAAESAGKALEKLSRQVAGGSRR